jgi:hypothetical protein
MTRDLALFRKKNVVQPVIFLKNLKIYLKLIFLIFLNYFDTLISKIIFLKIKKILS